MRIKEDNPVPNYIRVAGHRAVFDYPGVRWVCWRCRQAGHISTDCSAPFCERCGIYGHESTPCVLPCRRCGQAHATTSCEVPQLYRAVAGGFQAAAEPPVHPYHDEFPPVHNEKPAKTTTETDKEEPPSQVSTHVNTSGKDNQTADKSTLASKNKSLDAESQPETTDKQATADKEPNDSKATPGSPDWPSWEGVRKELRLSEDSDMETTANGETKRTRSSADTSTTPSTKKKNPHRKSPK